MDGFGSLHEGYDVIGRTFGHYRVTAAIGAGGMGEVWRARDLRLKRDVALKVLRAGVLADQNARRRFRKEALALSRLNHPNIETVHEFDTQDGTDYLVMEYVEGVTLSDRLRQSPLPEKELYSLGSQLAEGLAAAHARGVVHLDLKPGNLRVTPDGRLKILDFGLARLLAPEPGTKTDTTRSAEALQEVAGTLPYMAPEQLTGEGIDHRTDIWAAGVVLYEMATGRRPFEGPSVPALVTEIQSRPPTPPSQIRAGQPPALEPIILKCLAKDPDLRYQSARELHTDFRRATSSATETRAPQVSAPPSPGAESGRHRSDRRVPLWALAAALIVAAAGITGLIVHRAWQQERPGGSAAPITSLAVLPLASLSDQPDAEYVVDALHEALIAELSKISALRIISRTSTLRYRRSDTLLPQIARELGVDAVMEGSVLRSGDRVRVSAQLVRAEPERHVWADKYDRQFTDVLLLTSDIARTVASQIRVTLTPVEQASLARARPVNPAAYELYAIGRHQWGRRTLDGYRRAVESYERALKLDSDYAIVHAGLADTYMLLGEQGGLPQTDARRLAQAAITRALELDSDLAEAQVSLGRFKFYYEWNWEESARALLRAIELNPGQAAAHQVYGRNLAFLGRFDEGIRHLQRARELDPLSPSANAYLGQAYFFARQYELAGKHLEWTLTVSPNHPLVLHNLGELRLGEGRFEEALRWVQASVDQSPDPSVHYLAILAAALAQANQRSKALEIHKDLEERWARGFGSSFDLAIIRAAFGDGPATLALLERSYDERDVWLTEVKGWPWFDTLKSDPRYQDVIRKMNFPPGDDGR